MTTETSTTDEAVEPGSDDAIDLITIEKRLEKVEAQLAELRQTTQALADAAQQIAQTCEQLKQHPMLGQFLGG